MHMTTGPLVGLCVAQCPSIPEPRFQNMDFYEEAVALAPPSSKASTQTNSFYTWFYFLFFCSEATEADFASCKQVLTQSLAGHLQLMAMLSSFH